MSNEGEEKDSEGLRGIIKKFLKVKGGSECCGDIRIEEVAEDETEDKAETVDH